MIPRPSTQRPFIVPVFIPHAGCPHRCVFCNQRGTTGKGEAIPATDELHSAITRFLKFKKDPARYTEISFYGGNFLGLPAQEAIRLMEACTPYIHRGMAQGIRFSTRPDTIDAQRMALISDFPVTTIELGVQSMRDSVLKACRRGHTVSQVREAVALLKQTPRRIGLQMMVGLPGDTLSSSLATGRHIADLEPDFVRIYPTLVLKGSVLADWYATGRYAPLSLEEAVDIVKALYRHFAERRINVIRMGLQATEGLDNRSDMVAGPYHPAFGELVLAALWLSAMRTAMSDNTIPQGPVTITLHPRLVSRVQGYRCSNLNALRDEFSVPAFALSTTDDLPLDEIRMNGRPCRLFNKS